MLGLGLVRAGVLGLLVAVRLLRLVPVRGLTVGRGVLRPLRRERRRLDSRARRSARNPRLRGRLLRRGCRGVRWSARAAPWARGDARDLLPARRASHGGAGGPPSG